MLSRHIRFRGASALDRCAAPSPQSTVSPDPNYSRRAATRPAVSRSVAAEAVGVVAREVVDGPGLPAE